MTDLIIPGRPVTQGSMQVIKGRVITPPKVKEYRARVKTAYRNLPQHHGPVTVFATFGFARPDDHYGRGRNAERLKATAPQQPTSRRIGDLDKLCRALLDALTYAGAWADDSHVIHLNASKCWEDEDHTYVSIKEISPL